MSGFLLHFLIAIGTVFLFIGLYISIGSWLYWRRMDKLIAEMERKMIARKQCEWDRLHAKSVRRIGGI